jgi:UDP-N-acetyl-D-glucosamine dehydrogenase
LIADPTPLDENRQPDLTFVESAARTLGNSLKSNALVINESTSYPGTLRKVIAPIVNSHSSRGIKHLFAISPERVDPGNLKWKIRNTPRLIAGLTQEATEAAKEFYSKFCDAVVTVSSPEVAESAKLFENTFRQVNIALVNEFAMIMNSLGIPVHEVLDGANSKPYGFMKFTPGIGVGGHCIPVDPSYLAFASKASGIEPRFIELANKVNLEMPRTIINRIVKETGESLEGKKVLICGVAYKANIADTRESPSGILFDELKRIGAVVYWNDPNVNSWRGSESTDLGNISFDVTIVAVLHSNVNIDHVKDSAKFVFDCTGTITSSHQL